ncbi:MAG: hypothetical protein LQ342_007545 [Letrouitia transgressa]|nr:MAG: hypothetical protein LQ342_007545 [Letrouitia transgressa]
MTPPSEYGVGSLGPDSWSMGSLMLCEKAGRTVANVVATWEDSDGTWCLRRRDPPLTATTTPPGDSDVNRTYLCGNAAAMWLISPNVLCKVKGWIPGVTPEADTVKWVAKNCPNIPVPNIIYSWIDEAWQRSFCLVNVVPGVTLDDAWNELSKDDRTAIANEVVTYIIDAVQHTSPIISTVNGTGITFHGWILRNSEREIKGANSWQPDLHPIMTPEQLDQSLLQIGQKSPEKVDHFVFFHGDLAPVNVFVDKDKNNKWHVSSIIDWETAGFLPKWYIRTIVGFSPAYLLNQKDTKEQVAWSVELFRSLEEHGFQEYCEWLEDLALSCIQHPVNLPVVRR